MYQKIGAKKDTLPENSKISTESVFAMLFYGKVKQYYAKVGKFSGVRLDKTELFVYNNSVFHYVHIVAFSLIPHNTNYVKNPNGYGRRSRSILKKSKKCSKCYKGLV